MNSSENNRTCAVLGQEQEVAALHRHLAEVQSRISILHHELERRQSVYINPDTVRIKPAFQLLCGALLRRLRRRIECA